MILRITQAYFLGHWVNHLGLQGADAAIWVISRCAGSDFNGGV